MTIAQAGLAFRVSEPIDDLGTLVSSVLGEPATELAAPLAQHFDIRNPGDVMVQTFGDVCFLCNEPLVRPLLAGEDVRRVHRVLGQPSLLIAFCHDDLAGSYGYAVFERGALRRARTQCARDATASEHGAPLPFERRWLAAEHFVPAECPGEDPSRVYYLGQREVLVPERRLTGRMLQEGLEAHFEVCPWETLITPTYRFFRIEGAVAAPPAARQAPAPRKPWWRRA